MPPQWLFDKWKHQDEAIMAIRRISERKQAEKIEPARATWRELRDVLSPGAWKELELLIRGGYIKVYEAINFDTYEVDNYAVAELWNSRNKKPSFLGG